MSNQRTDSKNQTVLQVAESLYQQNPDWVTFFREVLGVRGIVREAFPDPTELELFEKSSEYEEIQRMVTQLRERSGSLPLPQEVIRVITVRLPESLHESLLHEAKRRGTSMNKLCIAKLMKMLDMQQALEEAAAEE